MKVVVERTKRLKKTWRRQVKGDVLVVRIPYYISKDEELRITNEAKRLHEKQNCLFEMNDQLVEEAERMNQKYFFGGLPRFTIEWDKDRKSRWGCCSSKRHIRINHTVSTFPKYVRQYLIVHELAHLLVMDHSENFWTLVHQFPHVDKAHGFLEGYAMASKMEFEDY